MLNEIYLYFFDPKKEGYTVMKTFVYSVVFLISIFLIYKFLKKQKIKIDNSFLIFSHFLALPFSALRVLEDYKIVEGILFITPWIEGLYILVFIVLISILKKFLKEKYEKPIFIFGPIVFFFFTFNLQIKNFYGIIIYSLIILITLFSVISIKINIFDRLFIIGQIFESLVTIFAVNFFGFYEQHVLSRFLLNISPLLYLASKLLFIILLIKILNKTNFEDETKSYIKSAFSVLSFSIGMRNILLVIAS